MDDGWTDGQMMARWMDDGWMDGQMHASNITLQVLQVVQFQKNEANLFEVGVKLKNIHVGQHASPAATAFTSSEHSRALVRQ